VLLVVGNGFFKPNISTMVSDLYPEGDARRDAAFTIFYMGINSGALIAPFVCSTLGEDPAYGWRYGYMAAGVGMLLSVVIQLVLSNRYLADIGKVPAAHRALAQAGGKKEPLTHDEVDRLRVVFMLFVFVVLFWAAFEQAGGLMNLYAAKRPTAWSATSKYPRAGSSRSTRSHRAAGTVVLGHLEQAHAAGPQPDDTAQDGARSRTDRHRLPVDGRRGVRPGRARQGEHVVARARVPVSHDG
jgi:MFS family permease